MRRVLPTCCVAVPEDAPDNLAVYTRLFNFPTNQTGSVIFTSLFSLWFSERDVIHSFLRLLLQRQSKDISQYSHVPWRVRSCLMKEIKHSASDGIQFETFSQQCHREMSWNWLAFCRVDFVKIPGKADPMESLKIFMYCLPKIVSTRWAVSAQFSHPLESLKNSMDPHPKIISTCGRQRSNFGPVRKSQKFYGLPPQNYLNLWSPALKFRTS